ncbi:MAG: hypothetical protein M3N47_12740 [Chloroflexota bacterium]|nr:hypothetical protein [Chloroflexota bacterium]
MRRLLFLSTLASYIEATGGELELVAAFPGDNRVALNIGDLADPGESRASPVEIVAEELGSR